MRFARIIKPGEVVTGLAGQECLCEVLELSSCDSHIICKMRRVLSVLSTWPASQSAVQ